jgi:uncharacterized protein YkwD
MHKLRGNELVGIAIALAVLVAIFVFMLFMPYSTPTDFITRLQNKLDALNYLNMMRAKEKAPPMQLVELNGAKWRVEYIARTGYLSHYDAEGRNPLYWYTRLDGGLYAVEEVISWSDQRHSAAYDFKNGIDNALSYKRDSLLSPCYNYIAMESSYVESNKSGMKVYVFWLLAKWVNWTSPPIYENGRFTAEGYVHRTMKPVAFVVYYSPYVRNAYYSLHYDLGDVYLYKYLEPQSNCAPEPNGTVVKALDNGGWYVKIDVPVALNKTGIYTFELIAEDIKEKGIRCPIMQYSVEVKK